MGVSIGEFEFDGMGDLAMTNPEGPFGLGMYDNAANPWAFGEFDVQDWDAIPTQSAFGCGCGLGAAPVTPAAAPGHKKFPWLAVGVGAAGLALGVGLAFGLRKLLKRK